MYAIVVDGAKQLRVSEGDIVRIDELGLTAGSKVTRDRILLVGDGKATKVGAPALAGAKVEFEVIREIKDTKTWTMKYRRRKAHSKTKKGHRQRHTVVKVTKISA